MVVYHGRPQTFFHGRVKISRGGGQKHTIFLKKGEKHTILAGPFLLSPADAQVVYNEQLTLSHYSRGGQLFSSAGHIGLLFVSSGPYSSQISLFKAKNEAFSGRMLSPSCTTVSTAWDRFGGNIKVIILTEWFN
jgi:hypothetical protein